MLSESEVDSGQVQSLGSTFATCGIMNRTNNTAASIISKEEP
uniref:Uncharacterized protein n=1 Tax=Arundo donax TaxID=35708 RepID=A0A0A9T2A3_ARUDO